MERVDDVTLLWDADYHDGPVSGLAAHAGEELWFEAVWDAVADEYASPRRYELRVLSPDEISDEWTRHRAFERYVGTKQCHHLSPAERALRPQDQWHHFYELFPLDGTRGYSDRPAVAWFTLADH
jgi:hypothetical protein